MCAFIHLPGPMQSLPRTTHVPFFASVGPPFCGGSTNENMHTWRHNSMLASFRDSSRVWVWKDGRQWANLEYPDSETEPAALLPLGSSRVRCFQELLLLYLRVDIAVPPETPTLGTSSLDHFLAPAACAHFHLPGKHLLSSTPITSGPCPCLSNSSGPPALATPPLLLLLQLPRSYKHVPCCYWQLPLQKAQPPK